MHTIRKMRISWSQTVSNVLEITFPVAVRFNLACLCSGSGWTSAQVYWPPRCPIVYSFHCFYVFWYFRKSWTVSLAPSLCSLFPSLLSFCVPGLHMHSTTARSGSLVTVVPRWSAVHRALLFSDCIVQKTLNLCAIAVANIDAVQSLECLQFIPLLVT